MNFRKYYAFILVTVSLICFASCKSTKTETADERPAIEDLSWIKKQSKNVDANYGMIRLRARKNLGTFNISVVDDMGKTIPLLATSNEYITSSFYLKAGKKIIKLNQDSSVNTYARKTDNGMQIAYVIDDIGNVIVDFTCFSSTKKNDIDTVKVTAHVVNKGKKRNEFELKVVLDTVLGETDRHHFYTASLDPVKNELSYKDIKTAKWFYSKNSNASMQFLFDGADTTKPELVALANLSTLTGNNWYPSMSNYRAFDTVLSYNNSAVGANWQKRKISVDESFEEIFYISTSFGKDLPIGNEYVYKNQKKNNQNGDAENTEDLNGTINDTVSEQPVEVIDDDVKDSRKNDKNNKPEKVNPEPEQITEKIEEKSAEPKQSEKIENYKLSKEYIQELLDRIAQIEDTGDSVSNQELIRLNMELDEILEELRK